MGKACLVAVGIRRFRKRARKESCWSVGMFIHCGLLRLHSEQVRWQDEAVLLMRRNGSRVGNVRVRIRVSERSDGTGRLFENASGD